MGQSKTGAEPFIKQQYQPKNLHLLICLGFANREQNHSQVYSCFPFLAQIISGQKLLILTTNGIFLDDVIIKIIIIM